MEVVYWVTRNDIYVTSKGWCGFGICGFPCTLAFCVLLAKYLEGHLELTYILIFVPVFVLDAAIVLWLVCIQYLNMLWTSSWDDD